MIEQLLEKCYNLTQDIKYSFNFSDNETKNSIMVKDKHFKGANYIIRICKSIENEFISQDLLNKNEILYMKIVNSEITKNIILVLAWMIYYQYQKFILLHI